MSTGSSRNRRPIGKAIWTDDHESHRTNRRRTGFRWHGSHRRSGCGANAAFKLRAEEASDTPEGLAGRSNVILLNSLSSEELLDEWRARLHTAVPGLPFSPSISGCCCGFALRCSCPAAFLARAAEQTPGATDRVLLFGEPSAKYLEESQITSDFELAAKKLAIRIEIVSRNELKSVYDNLSDDRRREAVLTAKRLVDEAQQEGRPRPGDAELEAAVRYSMAMHAIVVERGAMAAEPPLRQFSSGKGTGPVCGLDAPTGSRRAGRMPGRCRCAVDHGPVPARPAW